MLSRATPTSRSINLRVAVDDEMNSTMTSTNTTFQDAELLVPETSRPNSMPPKKVRFGGRRPNHRWVIRPSISKTDGPVCMIFQRTKEMYAYA
jgi:hypothetical protein